MPVTIRGNTQIKVGTVTEDRLHPLVQNKISTYAGAMNQGVATTDNVQFASVGIGTASPSTQLEVVTVHTDTGITISSTDNSTINTSTVLGILITVDDDSSGRVRETVAGIRFKGTEIWNATTTGGRLDFEVMQAGVAGGVSPAMSIFGGDSGDFPGYITVGTTTPEGFFTINSAGVNLSLSLESTDQYVQLYMRDNTTGAGADGEVIRRDGDITTYWSNSIPHLKHWGDGRSMIAAVSGGGAPDGTLHIYTASAGTVTANTNGDDLVVENTDNSGISILAPDAGSSRIYFGSPTANNYSVIIAEYNAGTPRVLQYVNGNATTGLYQNKMIVGNVSPAPDGTLHVHTDSAGVTTATSTADDLVVENSSAAGISILTPDANGGRLIFGSVSDNDYAQITAAYNSGNEYMHFTVVSEAMRIWDTGRVGVGTGGATPDGTLHVHTSSVGAWTANTGYDDLVIERGSGSVGISIAYPNNQAGGIVFSDLAEGAVDSMQHAIFAFGSTHASTANAFGIYASNAYRLVIYEDAGSTSYSNMSFGRNAGRDTFGTDEYDYQFFGGVTGSLILTDSLGGLTQKVSRWGSAHYDVTNEEPMALMMGVSSSTNNTIDIGGGTSLFNAATRINFLIASNNTTTTGTTRGFVNSSGNWILGDSSVQPDGTLHVHTATVGSVTASTAGDDLVIENNGNGGISILVPDANDANLYFGSLSDNVGAFVQWNHNNNLLRMSTSKTSAEITFGADTGTEVMRISNGKVGILTAATPNYPFEVRGALNDGAIHAHFGTGTYGVFIQNLTNTGFIPTVVGTGYDSNDYGLALLAQTTPGNDTGTAPLFWLSARRTGGAALTARNIIEIDNLTTTHLLMDYAGKTMISQAAAVQPDGTLHVHTASAGAITANTSYDDLVVENNGNTGINILAPDASTTISGILFGYGTDNTVHGIEGRSPTQSTRPGTLNFYANNDYRMVIGNDGQIFVGDVSTWVDTTFMDKGIIIHDNNSAKAMLIMQTSFSHGMTTLADTDSFTHFGRDTGSGGGRWTTFTSDQVSSRIQGHYTNTSTGKTTTANGGLLIELFKASGTGRTAVLDANQNLVNIRRGGTNVWIVDEDGDVFYGGTDDGTITDAYDDVPLLVGMRALLSPKDSPARKRFTGFIQDTENVLVQQGVLSAPIKDGGMISTKGLNGLMIDGMNQLYNRINELENELAELKAKYI